MPDQQPTSGQPDTGFGAGQGNRIQPPEVQQEPWTSQSMPRKADSKAGEQLAADRPNSGNPTVRTQTFSGREVGRMGYFEENPGPHGQVARESGSLEACLKEGFPAALAGHATPDDVQQAGSYAGGIEYFKDTQDMMALAYGLPPQKIQDRGDRR